MRPQPPRRTTHAHGTPKNLLVYDRWGRFGRPVVLLHGLLYDRTMWWPVAADLDDDCAAVAVDLPGHGQSAARDGCGLDRLTHDLAMLIHGLGLHRAPIMVAHAGAVRLAAAFADRYATHAVVAFDEPAADPPTTVEQVLCAADLDGVPEHYRGFAVARRDPGLLDAYQSWFTCPPSRTSALTNAAGGKPAEAGGQRFPHLRDPDGFARRLRRLSGLG